MSKISFKDFQEKAAVNMQYMEKEAITQNMALGYTEAMAQIMEKVESVNLEFVTSLGAAGAICSSAKKLYEGDPSSEDVKDVKRYLGNALVNIAVLGKYFRMDLEDIAMESYEGIAVITDTGKISGAVDEEE